MRVAVYAISLNEAAHVPRFLAACAGADLVCVADTGSSDGTVEQLRAGGAEVHAIRVRPWRFDDARNASLALLPSDVDVCVALDLDEVLNPGWRADVEASWRPGSTRGHYLYAWSHNADGRPEVEFWSDKIHARHGYRWRHPCHEALYPDRMQERHVYFHGLRVDHWPDSAKSRSQYLPLLQVAVREDPQSSRDAFYLGRELFLLRQFEAAEAELGRYLALPTATWADQNSAAMDMLARCREAAKDLEGALAWFRAATDAAPERREGWADLTDALYRRKAWGACLEAARRALALPDSPTASANARQRGRHDPADVGAIAAWRLGDHATALGLARDAAARTPGDERLDGNVRFYERALQKEAQGKPEVVPASSTST